MKEEGDGQKREDLFLNQSQIPRLAQERNTWLQMGDMYLARCRRSRRQVVDSELHQALAQCVCVEEGMGWGVWIFTGNLSATDQSERSRATMPPFSDA